jgi:iron-siderophore transport system permease protein
VKHLLDPRPVPFGLGSRGPAGAFRPRVATVCLALAVLVVLACGAELVTGDYPISPAAAGRALFWYGDQSIVDVVYQLRLPRALAGLLAGMAFGAGGAVFQSLARNPLASPDVIGVTAGANTAAVAGLVLGLTAAVDTATLALLGAAASAVATYLLAWRGGTTGSRFVVVGIGVSALCASMTAYLLQRANLFEAQQAALWLTGSLNLRQWSQILPLAVAVVVLLPVVLLAARHLPALTLGEDTARGLGVPVARTRLTLMAGGVGLVAFATAAAGPIAFVALIAPQLTLRLARAAVPPPLGSSLAGALIVLLADLAARPFGLPTGVVTGIVGAPYLLWLLARTNRTGSVT